MLLTYLNILGLRRHPLKVIEHLGWLRVCVCHGKETELLQSLPLFPSVDLVTSPSPDARLGPWTLHLSLVLATSRRRSSALNSAVKGFQIM